ncbi:MAG: hypothetical protein LBS21_00150 [Clostridiales bacterium]|jgi:hypothetical protein|nr:hypothetical protein [Clostridiales bacterium]
MSGFQIALMIIGSIILLIIALFLAIHIRLEYKGFKMRKRYKVNGIEFSYNAFWYKGAFFGTELKSMVGIDASIEFLPFPVDLSERKENILKNLEMHNIKLLNCEVIEKRVNGLKWHIISADFEDEFQYERVFAYSRLRDGYLRLSALYALENPLSLFKEKYDILLSCFEAEASISLIRSS